VPVYHAHKDGILVITADGDYTTSEMRRVAEAAVASPDTQVPARILLDMSGAASMKNRTSDELFELADFFTGLGDNLDAVAVLAPDEASYGLMRMGMTLYTGRGVRADVFRARPEAVGWLNGAS
jgi:hypothetical protein